MKRLLKVALITMLTLVLTLSVSSGIFATEANAVYADSGKGVTQISSQISNQLTNKTKQTTTESLLKSKVGGVKLFSLGNWTDSAAIAFSGGNGSESSPYLISTAAELARLAVQVNSGNAYEGKYFALTSDIDLSGAIWTPIGIANDSSEDLKTNDAAFKGNFDGRGHTISNMTADVGGIAGGLFGCTFRVTIKNLNVTGTVSGYDFGGGIIGLDKGNSSNYPSVISNCSYVGDVTADIYAGGIGGDIARGKIFNSYVKGNITVTTGDSNNSARIGGIAGVIYGAVTNCYAVTTLTNNATGSKQYNGGIVGASGLGTTISYSYWLDEAFSINGDSNNYTYSNVDFPFVSDRFNITAYGNGLINSQAVEITREWGNVSWAKDTVWVMSHKSSTGTNTSNIFNNVAYIDGYGNTVYPELGNADYPGTGPSTITLVDMLNKWVLNNNSTYCGGGVSQYARWTMEGSASGYPIFKTPEYWSQAVTQDPGTTHYEENDNKILIKSEKGLAWLASVVNGLNGETANSLYGKTVVLTANLDLGDYRWTAIGSLASPFAGIFDGNGKTISNMRIEEGENNYQGLFGYVLDNNTEDEIYTYVIDVGIIDASIYGKSYVGGVAACIKDAYVIGCYTSGEIVSTATTNSSVFAATGGIVGYNRGYIANCYNNASVTAVNATLENSCVGGITGANAGKIFNCYSRGSVSSQTQAVGGVAGVNGGKINYSYYLKGSVRSGSSLNTANVGSGVTAVVSGITAAVGTNNGVGYFENLDASIPMKLTADSGQTLLSYGADATAQQQMLPQLTAFNTDVSRSFGIIEECYDVNWKITTDVNDNYPHLYRITAPKITIEEKIDVTSGVNALTMDVEILDGYKGITWTIAESEDSSNILTMPSTLTGAITASGEIALGDFTLATQVIGSAAKSAKFTISFSYTDGATGTEYTDMAADMEIELDLAAYLDPAPSGVINYSDEKITLTNNGVSPQQGLEYVISTSQTAPTTGWADVTTEITNGTGNNDFFGKYVHIRNKARTEGAGLNPGNVLTLNPNARPTVSDFTYNGLTVTYDANSHALTITKSVNTMGDVTITSYADGASYSSSSAPTNAATYTVTFNVAASSTYPKATGLTKTMTISQKELTPVVSVDSKNYDGTTATQNLSITLSGALGSDAPTLASGYTGAWSSANAGTTTVALSNLSLESGFPNYKVSSTKTVTAKDSAQINQVTLTPTVGSVTSRAYDGTTSGSGTISLSGAVNSEAPTATATFAWTSANAGTTTVNVTSITLGSSWTTNYKLSVTSLSNQTAPSSAKISKRSITVTAADKSCYYDAAVPTYTVTSTNLVSTHTITATLTCTYAKGNAVSTYTITPSSAVIKDAGGNDVSSNYDVTSYTNGTLTVSKLLLTKPTTGTTSYYYTGAEQAFVPASYNSAYMTIANDKQTATGTYTNVTVSLKASTNYAWADGTTTDVTLTFEIKKAEVTITTAPTASSIKSGIAISNSALSGGVASVAGTFAWTTGTTTCGSGTNSYSVTFTPTDTTNYAVKTVDVSITNYTVTFNNQNGSSATVLTMATNAVVPTPSTNPTKSGYTFGGWSNQSGGTTAYDFVNSGATSNSAFYAIWIANNKTIIFNTNGGTSVSSKTSLPSGCKVTAPTAPTKTDCLFDGWYSDQALTTKWNFATDILSDSMTLYAKWKTNVTYYTVSFEANGGTTAPSQMTDVASDSKIAAPAAMTKSGYGFCGWYKDFQFNTKWNFAVDKVTDNITLYAKWSQNVYTVTGAFIDDTTPTPNNVGGVTVKIMYGNTLLEQTTLSGAVNNFSFSGLPNGTYNIVATKGEVTVTSIITISGANGSLGNIVIPTRAMSSVVEIKNETPDIVVGGLDDALANEAALITEDDEIILDNSGKVERD